MKLKRNQVIVTALCVMIAVAGYLNYTDVNTTANKTKVTLSDNGEILALVPYDESGVPTNDDVYSDISEIGDALTMDDTGNMINQEAVTVDSTGDLTAGTTTDVTDVLTSTNDTAPADAGEAIFVNTSLKSSFFVQAKLEREQARSKQKDILMGLINDAKIDSDKKSVCADAMLEIQKRIEKETAAEAMIESKGFKEVYVRIDDTTVDVVVNKDALSDAEIAQIEDIVKRKTGMTADQIRISAMKK